MGLGFNYSTTDGFNYCFYILTLANLGVWFFTSKNEKKIQSKKRENTDLRRKSSCTFEWLVETSSLHLYLPIVSYTPPPSAEPIIIISYLSLFIFQVIL